MFRFWSSDSRGSERIVDEFASVSDESTRESSASCESSVPTALSSPSQPKKRSLSYDEPLSPAKRAKIYETVETSPSLFVLSSPPPASASPNSPASSCNKDGASPPSSADSCEMERARDEIRHQFGLEILMKHNELRLINQELAKCQIALEQLRRCHLIPYPVNYPTPDQILDISNGKGPALAQNGEPIPQWAPPFGVVDGPYARHYAKWLIPDPAFDGMQPEWQYAPNAVRMRGSVVEGRTTRNSFGDANVVSKGRHGRGLAGQKLQALSSGYPLPKDKAGPCVLKRADGQTVKLVCIDCHRENFSSTQGFINHCRIAHKRDFKSHEEAAVHCGHIIDATDSNLVVKEKKAPASKTPTSIAVVAAGTPTSSTASSSTLAFVHPFARDDMTEQEAYIALSARISESLKLYNQGKLPGLQTALSVPSKNAVAAETGCKDAGFVPSREAPWLSRLLEKNKFQGNVEEFVAEAKTKMSICDMSPGEESDEVDISTPSSDGVVNAQPTRTPGAIRLSAKSAKSPVTQHASSRPVNRGLAAPLAFVSSFSVDVPMLPRHRSSAVLSDEELDLEESNLSPNTFVGNNAPSLVSDDGEYDDSDEGSSVAGDLSEAQSVSDLAEITLDDDHDPRALRRGSTGMSGPMRLRKDEPSHVTFIGPVQSTAKARHSRNF